MKRRDILGMAVGLPMLAGFPSLANAGRPDISRLRTRPSGPVEVLYKTPHGKPNGLDLTSEGMWVMDQGPDNYISLIAPDTGTLIREFKPSNVRAASGICADEDGTMWVGSTYNRLIVHLDPRTGRTIEAFQTPGAGLHYTVAGDLPSRGSTLPHAYPEPPPPPSATPAPVSRLGDGRVPLDWPEAPPGTGSHCLLQKGNLLYIVVPNARTIFVVDKKSWVVQDYFATAGNRPHDMTWTDATKTRAWVSDSNLNAFFLTDMRTGEMSERIQLPSDSPVIHGAKLYNGYIYCCDDTGWMFRFKL